MQTLLSEVAAAKNQEIHSISPDASVADAVRSMHANNVGALMVLDEGRVAGVFTERDVLFRVVDDALDPKSTPVSRVMTKDPFSVAPTTTVEDAMRQVTEKRVRHLPLMEGDKLLAMISSGDLTRWVVREQEQKIEGLSQNVKSIAAKNKALIALVAAFGVLIVVGVMTA